METTNTNSADTSDPSSVTPSAPSTPVTPAPPPAKGKVKFNELATEYHEPTSVTAADAAAFSSSAASARNSTSSESSSAALQQSRPSASGASALAIQGVTTTATTLATPVPLKDHHADYDAVPIPSGDAAPLSSSSSSSSKKTSSATAAGGAMLLSAFSEAKKTNTAAGLYTSSNGHSPAGGLGGANGGDEDDSMMRMSLALQKEIQPFNVIMEDLSYSIDIVKNGTLKDRLAGREKTVERKYLLSGITGVLRPRTMTALMGPSGAGKSTLLDVIAGRKTSGFIEGSLLFNNKPRSHDFKRMCGYVEQRDILLGTLTVKELLYYTAKLRLPSTYSDEACKKRVVEVMKQLGLVGCADVLIGDELHRGISGGQAKRVNIGIELITCPSILFLDEPTSGLDATTALDVMKVVRRIRDGGTTVVCTIHQPSTDIYNMFDRLMLLVGGEVVYLGAADLAVDYFVDLGFKYRENTNPAEFMVAATSDNQSGNTSVEGPVVPKGFFAQQYKQSALAELRKISTKRAQNDEVQELREEQPLFVNNAMYNFKVLLGRNYKKASRDPGFLRNRVIIPSIVAILFLLVYRDSPYTSEGIRNRQALMMLTVTYFTIGANIVLGGLINDRLFFTRERNAASYQVSSYYIALILLELPYMIMKGLLWSLIIYWGCNFSRTAEQFFFFTLVTILLADFGNGLAQFFSAAIARLEPAAAAMTTLPLLFIIFSGFFIFPSAMPAAWRYTAYYISYCNYALAALIINEFYNADDFTTTGYFCYSNTTSTMCPAGLSGCSTETIFLTSSQILASLGVSTGFFSSRFANLMLLLLIWFVLRVAGYLALRFVRHGSR